MKKVAHICTAASMYNKLVDKLSILQKRGYIVHLISSNEGYDKDYMSKYKLTIHFIDMNKKINIFDDVRSLVRMIKLLRSEKYDIVHTHNAKAGIIGRVAAWITRTPVIVHTSHGLPFYIGQNKITFHIYRFLEKIGAYFCNAITSQNKEDIKLIENYTSKDKVFFEGNGVDLAHLDEEAGSVKEEDLLLIKEKYSIPQSSRVIFVGARFELVKDHFFLLEGLKELQDRYNKDFVCLLAGEGPLEQTIQQKIDEMGLSRQVKITGFKTNPYPYIKLADIVALTSEKEGIPRIIMEAMAFFKPVVATDVLGTRELVRDKETGLLVPYKDKKVLAQSLDILIRDESLRIKFGNNARHLIEEEFTEQMVVQRIDQLYKQLSGNDKVADQMSYGQNRNEKPLDS